MHDAPQSGSSTFSDADFEAAHDARLRARRKALWWLVGGFGLLFALFAYVLIADEPPPDTSDLRVTFTHPPDEKNAYALLTKLTASLPPPLPGGSADEKHFKGIFTGDYAWDRAVIAKELARYAPDLAQSVWQALDAPDSEAPELKSFDAPLPEVGPIRRLGQILTQHAALAWHDGDHLRATELNLLALRLGHRVSQSRGYFIVVLTGTGIECIALDSIRRHVDSPDTPASALRRYLADLPAREISINDYHHAYKLEHQGVASLLLTSFDGGFSSLSGGPKAVVDSLAAAPGVYQPHRTIRWHAEFVRAQIAHPLPAPLGTRSPGSQIVESLVEAPWPKRAQNYTGRKLLGRIIPSLDKVTLPGHRVRANLRLSQIYVALRLHQLEHDGELPSELTELIPAYLAAIPQDPFDEQPLGYDRSLTTIWSVDASRRAKIDAEGDLPKGAPAYRLLFARPTQILPTFAEQEALEDGSTKELAGSEGNSPSSDVSPSK
jgi:hypothetical protein